MLTVISTREIGERIKLMDMAHSLTPTELDTLEIGSTICSMEKARRAGTMARQSTLGPSSRERSMEKVDSNGKMVASMRVTS
jgi:hypothetical protein